MALRLEWSDEWGQRFRHDLAELLAWARGCVSVRNYEVEGVTDTTGALTDPVTWLTDPIAQPGVVRGFADRVTDLLIEFAR